MRTTIESWSAIPARAGCGLVLLSCFAACGDSASEPKLDGKTAVESIVDVPHFTDVLADSGITFRHRFLDSESGSTFRVNPYDHGSGVCAVDVDGDGLDDILFLNFLGSNALYLNRGGMRFEDVTEASGIALPRALKVGAAFGDYDDDGDVDLYVTTYRGGNHLFENRGNGTFEDVTGAAEVGYKGHSSAATWFDYDLDGDLDLYLCNIGVFTTETISREADYFYTGVSLPFAEVAKTPDRRQPGEPNILYRNEGEGRFTDVTAQAGVDAAEWNGDVAVADIDLDGDLDLYTSNMFGANHLYRNEGRGTFSEITNDALGRTSWGGMGARFFDANGDEYPDLYVVDMHSDMWIDSNDKGGFEPNSKFNTPTGTRFPSGRVISSPEQTQASSVLFGNTYFENRGDAHFVERSGDVGLETWWPWGIAVGDFDNDGWEDLFVPSGMGYPFVYWPNQFLMNDRHGRFVEVAARAGLEPPRRGQTIEGEQIRGKPLMRSSRTAAVADFDSDGDLDIVVNNFNHEPYLFRNDSKPGNALRLRLRPSSSASDAFGARIKVTGGGRVWNRVLAGAQGYLTQSSKVVHIGLGPVTRVDGVEVYWPGHTQPQRLTVSRLDEIIEVVQE